MVLEVVGTSTLKEDAPGCCVCPANLSSLVATHVVRVLMADMTSLRVRSGSSSVRSDETRVGGGWALFLVLDLFVGVLHCLFSFGALVTRYS